MPSSTPKQARFMAAVARGWQPNQTPAPPKAVAQEFHQADVERSRAPRQAHYQALALRASAPKKLQQGPKQRMPKADVAGDI